jgi:phage gp36-like protein
MVQSLATLADLAALPGLPAQALASVSDPSKQAALDAASSYALGKIGHRYKRPLVSWETDLIYAVCKIAVYDLLVARGYSPGAGADPNIRMRRDDADQWLTHVARQEISPLIVGAADQSPGFDNPRILGLPSQGWQGRRIG